MNIEQNLNIKKIPSGWSIQRVKEVASWQTGFTPDTKKSEYYDGNDEWITIGDLDGKYVKASKNKINGKFFPKEWITPANSLLFSFKLSIGQVAFNEKEVYTNEAICSFSPKSKINLNYFYYAAPYFIVKNANKNIYGADLLNQELIANALLIVPPKEQQIAIANYLDTETSKIDRKISILEQKYEKLEEYKQSVIFETVTKGLDKNVELKDSGIDWIGDIPKHWEVKRVKECFKLKSGDLIDKSKELGEYSIFGANGIIGSTNKINIKDNTLLIGRVGSAGAVNLVNKGFASDNSLIVTIGKNQLTKYYYYYLKIFNFEDIISKTSHPLLVSSKLLRSLIATTDLNEQNKIVDYLDIFISKIEKKVEIIKKQIELLKEYKQTIIYEAVTGKMEIL